MMMLTFLLALLTFQSSLQTKKPRTNRELLTPALQKELAEVEGDYGVHFAINESELPAYLNGIWGISGEVTLSIFLEEYLPHLLFELRLYPPALFRHLKVSSIICGQNLRHDGQWLNGAAEPHTGTLYFNVFSFGDGHWSDEEKLILRRKTVHHELFHLIDARLNQDAKDDLMWSGLGERNFEYGLRKFYLSKSQWPFSNQNAGFITAYSMASATEDKAEVFGAMMSNLHEMEARGKDDPVLSRKIERIKEMGVTFCPEINGRFWQRMRYLDRPRLTPIGHEDNWAENHQQLEPLPRLASEVTTLTYLSEGRFHRHRIHWRRR